MKIPKLLPSIFLLFFYVNTSFSQVNYGFTSSAIELGPKQVKSYTNTIVTALHVYFIAAADSKIYDVVWDVPTSTWIPATAPLGGASCPAVKNGTNFVNFGDELYFVSATDSKIYKLKYTSGPGWQFSIVNTIQVAVAGNNIFLRTHAPSAGWDIYYIGTGGKICQIYFDGTTYGYGAQLVAGQTANALTTSPLVVSNTAVYYICSADNKIYRVYWSSGWTGGTVPLVSTSTAVRSLSNIVNENNDLDHLYYVNTSNQICELVNSGAWTYTVIPTGTEVVRSSTDIVCSFGSIFYVKNSDSNISRVWKTATWNSESVLSQQPVAPFAQIFVWANDIIEETTVNTTFKSFHVFYPSTTPTYGMNVSIYDDKNVPFASFGCYDGCDNNTNGTGWDDPLPNHSTTPHPGYDCSLYNVAGIKPKVWYSGYFPLKYAVGATTNNQINLYGKHFFFVGGTDGKVYDFSRSPLNGTVKTGYGSLNWSDEFSASGLNASTWSDHFGWGNHNPTICYDIYWNEPANISQIGDGILKLKVDNVPATHTLSLDRWDCGYGGSYSITKQYNYNTAVITSEGKKLINEGSFTEARFQIPRSNRLWPTFWFPYNGDEDINFEFEGDGKNLMFTLFDTQHKIQQKIISYAVGFRYYDDYYTYGFSWNTDGVGLYVNNTPIYTFANIENHCHTPREAIFDVEVSDANIHAACTPAIFPVYYNIDYIRSWNAAGHSPLLFNTQTSTKDFKMFPNPAHNKINIEGDEFSKAEIYNVQGEKIFESKSKEIEIENFSNGIYFIKITRFDGSIYNSKFIKE